MTIEIKEKYLFEMSVLEVDRLKLNCIALIDSNLPNTDNVIMAAKGQLISLEAIRTFCDNIRPLYQIDESISDDDNEFDTGKYEAPREIITFANKGASEELLNKFKKFDVKFNTFGLIWKQEFEDEGVTLEFVAIGNLDGQIDFVYNDEKGNYFITEKSYSTSEAVDTFITLYNVLFINDLIKYNN